MPNRLKRLNIILAYFLFILLVGAQLVLFFYSRKQHQQDLLIEVVDQQLKRIQSIHLNASPLRWKDIEAGYRQVMQQSEGIAFSGEWQMIINAIENDIQTLNELKANGSQSEAKALIKISRIENHLLDLRDFLSLRFKLQNQQLIQLTIGLIFCIFFLLIVGYIFVTRPLIAKVKSKSKTLEDNNKQILARDMELEEAMAVLSKTKDSLMLQEHRFRSISENITEIIVLLSASGVVDYISPSCSDQLGYAPEDIVRGTVTSIIASKYHPPFEEALQRVMAGENEQVTLECICRNEELIWMEAKLKCIKLDENAVFLMTLRNVEAEKQMETLLNGTQAIAGIGGFDVDIAKQQVRCTAQVYHILKVSQGGLRSLQEWLQMFSIATVEDFLSMLQINDHCFDKELQLSLGSGEQVWIKIVGEISETDGQVSALRGTIQNVQAQKDTEERLKKQDLAVEQVMKSSPNLIVVMDIKKYKITYENRSFWNEMAYGTEQPEMERWRKLLSRADLELLQYEVNNVASSGTDSKVSIEIQVNKGSGAIHWYQVVICPFSVEKEKVKEVLLTLNDIQHKKKAEEHLRKNMVSLKAFVGDAPAAIAMLDNELRFVAVSDRFKEDYRTKKLQLIGESYHSIFPETSQLIDFLLTRGLKGVYEEEEEMQVFRCDGKEEWAKWEMRPWFTDDYEIGGVLIFSQFVTEEKQRKEELIEARLKAEEASKTKAQFLSTMSHEIRTPMNAVVGLSHILLEENPREDQLDYLSKLKFSGESLLGLINDILDFSKIESGKLDIEKVPFHLKKDIEGVTDMLQFKAIEKRIGLKLSVDDNVPEAVIGDPVRIRQILVNLINNAIKFTAVGSVEVKVKALKVTEETCKIRFQVVDTGIGIPEDKLDTIFQSFSQVSTDTTRKFGGTGLGLTITKRLCELQGGDVKVSSQEQVGSVFMVDIPYQIPSNMDLSMEKQAAAQDVPDVAKLKGLRVLLVEDNAINQFVATKFMSKYGIVTEVAEHGGEAVEMVQQHRYDVILMDLEMPVMDGFEATKAIKSLDQPYFKELPIIAMTASALTEIQKKVFEWGMVDFIAKPFEPAMFYRTLLKHGRPQESDKENKLIGTKES
ncbi:PAS domain S-box protein [Persicobacter psychrovividus]|uniref:histidine kinase n=1 Tax=Persicobacter psychrovividus TaxID=387638 RepID=A0ABM7VBS9_9BACT|nr:hypothetical protein PEPS_06700 [Persicobacter psychrovividus]